MFDWLSDVKREEMMRWRALFKDVDRNVMRTFACIKRLEERTRNTLELYRIKRKHKKDNIDAPSHNIDPIQLHKRQERCRVHR